jgi:hypothetical protein
VGAAAVIVVESADVQRHLTRYRREDLFSATLRLRMDRAGYEALMVILAREFGFTYPGSAARCRRESRSSGDDARTSERADRR